MRGKAQRLSLPLVTAGITPAYAGKSDPVLLCCGMSQDHPRLCGEKFISLYPKYAIPGSPPPMRGKVIFGLTLNTLRRITPAYAGKRECE